MSNLKTMHRTHTCGELRAEHAGKRTKLAGFVHHTMEGGSFVLRDEYGKTLVVAGPGSVAEVRETVPTLRRGDVVRVEGEVSKRVMPALSNPTGEVYALPDAIEVLARTDQIPHEAETQDPPLEYRHLELRRPEIQRALRERSRLLLGARRYLTEKGFAEVETPLLTSWTKHDADSFLAPTDSDLCYGLVGTRQLYQQLLTVADYERYFQVGRRFRKERRFDGSRQPEYSVLELGMAYVGEDEVIEVVEGLLAHLVETVLGRTLERPFMRVSYDEALKRFGTARPDLRHGLELKALTPAVRAAKSFRFIVREEGTGRGFRVPGAADQIPDDELDRLHSELRSVAVHKLAWLKVGAEGKVRGSGATDFAEKLNRPLQAQPGDLLLVVGGPNQAATDSVADELCRRMVQRLNLAPPERLSTA
ncbi:amino acid--tRNA ligase-related protein, partial [Planctomycetota bacterium]